MPDYKITTGLPQLPVQGDEKSFNLVLPLYQGMNALAKALSIATGNVDYSQTELAQRNQLASLQAQNVRKLYTFCPLALDYGKVVNLYLDSGKIAAREASAASAATAAHGIVNVPQGIAAGAYGEILLIEGLTMGIAGTTIGATYYLSTGGVVSLARPVGAGTIVQAIGIGMGTAGFYAHISSYFHVN